MATMALAQVSATGSSIVSSAATGIREETATPAARQGFIAAKVTEMNHVGSRRSSRDPLY
jgi:hypothetical protein